MARFRGSGRKPNVLFAVFMIGAGILLFLSNLGLLPVRNVWDYWPLIFVALGVGKFDGSRHLNELILGGVFIIFGVLFTLVNTGTIPVRAHDDSWPLSLLFIALGLGGLGKVFTRRSNGGFNAANTPPGNQMQGPLWPTKENWSGWSANPDVSDSAVLDNVALMSTVKRRVETTNFQGGALIAFWGNIELDLRRAQLAAGQNSVTLDANAIMGSIKLRIPETWRVDWNGLNLMASFQDKTIPPVIGVTAPQLIVTGYSIMGNIEVES